MSNSTTLLDTISANQASKEVVVNANFDAASPAMIWGRRASTTNGLTWGYYGGYYNGNAVANGTVTLTASTTNYIYANAATGAVSVNTTGVPAGTVGLYSVVTGTTTATSYTDLRCYAPAGVSVGPYDVGGYVAGLSQNGEIVWSFYSPRPWTLPSGASGGGKSRVAATGSTAYTIKKEGVSIGTLTWAAGATVATLSITSSTSFTTADLLTLETPATADATLSDLSFTFAGTRP
ncbi:hypothetical protein [Cupriavidus alkaliphilus]|uniref:hypothetical protein n=1 Tax=Cupriavidus alkaliphilus TaxID=942866 RepID=UPI00161E8C4C|nr:hypothetical protein [Cupriavidus alkaliphilus]MBB2915850.1 hypothetical protein [Cupriavidus alkaliphilus]